MSMQIISWGMFKEATLKQSDSFLLFNSFTFIKVIKNNSSSFYLLYQ